MARFQENAFAYLNRPYVWNNVSRQLLHHGYNFTRINGGASNGNIHGVVTRAGIIYGAFDDPIYDLDIYDAQSNSQAYASKAFKLTILHNGWHQTNLHASLFIDPNNRTRADLLSRYGIWAKTVALGERVSIPQDGAGWAGFILIGECRCSQQDACAAMHPQQTKQPTKSSGSQP